MSDQDEQQGDPAPKNDPQPDEPLGEGGLKALNAERDARAAAEKVATELQNQLNAATEALAAAKSSGQPEWQQKLNELQAKLDGEVAARQEAEKAAQAAATAQLRTDRAVAKGLPLALAKKLTATTADELDTEIDELLPLLGAPGPKPNPQQGNPSQGRGGTLDAGRELFKQQNSKT